MPRWVTQDPGLWASLVVSCRELRTGHLRGGTSVLGSMSRGARGRESAGGRLASQSPGRNESLWLNLILCFVVFSLYVLLSVLLKQHWMISFVPFSVKQKLFQIASEKMLCLSSLYFWLLVRPAWKEFDAFIGLAKRFLQFLSKNKRHIFHFHQELYWKPYSPFCSTTFCRFPGNFIIPSSQNFYLFEQRTVPGAFYSIPGNWNFFH